MKVEQAIVILRNWRSQQNLDSLPPQEEREQAIKLIKDKGYNLPDFIPDGQGSLQLVEGVYVNKETETTTLSLVENIDSSSSPASPTSPSPIWEPHDKREFWCDRHKSFVRLTGDLDVNGTYWVNKSGEGTFNRYPAKANELVLRENAPTSAPDAELLLINSVGWGDIKNCLVNKFIPTYPWSKKGEKTPTEVREEMLLLAKSRKAGLASFIEEERKLGRFEDSQNFILRMNSSYESFPWGDFTQMLDFN